MIQEILGWRCQRCGVCWLSGGHFDSYGRGRKAGWATAEEGAEVPELFDQNIKQAGIAAGFSEHAEQ